MANVEWFINEEKYSLTVEQEFFCWRFCLHGNASKAVREAYTGYNGKPKNQSTKSRYLRARPNVAERCRDLLASHRNGVINLRDGPWKYYNRFDVGNPYDLGNSLKGVISEIREEVYGEFS